MTAALRDRPEYKLGVVVPVHNAADYLLPCLGSIAAQSHQNLFCVLVEDGSTDASAEICTRFAARDARFTLLRQPQSGVAAARAAGLAVALQAGCAAIAFADADDLYHRDLLLALLTALLGSGLPIAACRYDTFTAAPPADAPAPKEFRTLPAPQHLAALLHDHTVDYGLWNKLYAAELIRPAVLANGYRANEDLLANWELFRAAPGIACCDFAGYHYRQHAASASHRPLSAESVAQQWEIAKKIRDTAPDAIRAAADSFYYEKLVYLTSMILRRRDAAPLAPELSALTAELRALGGGARGGKNPALAPAVRAAGFAAAHCRPLYALACRALLRDRR